MCIWVYLYTLAGVFAICEHVELFDAQSDIRTDFLSAECKN